MRLSLCTVAPAALAACSVTHADSYAPPPPATGLLLALAAVVYRQVFGRTYTSSGCA